MAALPRAALCDAFSVLTHALRNCRSEDMRTPGVLEALDTLSAAAREQWPHRQFRRSLDIGREEDRWQTANAALNGIRLQLPRGV
jgi:uncharacterized protein (UPF0548 family)